MKLSSERTHHFKIKGLCKEPSTVHAVVKHIVPQNIPITTTERNTWCKECINTSSRSSREGWNHHLCWGKRDDFLKVAFRMGLYVRDGGAGQEVETVSGRWRCWNDPGNGAWSYELGHKIPGYSVSLSSKL